MASFGLCWYLKQTKISRTSSRFARAPDTTEIKCAQKTNRMESRLWSEDKNNRLSSVSLLAKKAAVENNELKGRRESLLVFDCIKSSKTTKRER